MKKKYRRLFLKQEILINIVEIITLRRNKGYASQNSYKIVLN